MIREVTKATGVTEKEILAQNRKPIIALARRIYWLLLKSKGGFRVGEIAKLCNKKSSTVTAGLKKIEQDILEQDVITMILWNRVRDIKYMPPKIYSKEDVMKHLESYLK